MLLQLSVSLNLFDNLYVLKCVLNWIVEFWLIGIILLNAKALYTGTSTQ